MSRRKQLEDLLKENPDDVFLRYALALQDDSEGHTDQALAQLEQILQDHPDYVPAYFQGGRMLAQLGRNQPAREWLQRGIAQAKRCGDAHAADEMQQLLESLD